MSNKKIIENVEAMENTEVVENTENVVAEETVKELPKITLDDFKAKVKFKDYIPFSDKKSILDLVWKNCVVKDEEHGIYYIDSIMRDIAFHLAILRYYTDFYDVYEYAEEYSYDELAKSGIFERLEYLNDDIELINNVVQFDFDNRVNAMNSTGSVLHRLLNGLLDKMPDVNKLSEMMQELPKVLNNVDPKVIEMFGKDFKNGTV